MKTVKRQQTHNYQQLNLKNTKQTTRTETEPQKWRSYGGYQLGGGRGRMREKVQG